MHKNIVFFKVVLDIAMRFFKMRIYGLILIIQDINPLMFLNFVPFDLVFDLKKVEFFTVNDWKDTVDPKIFLDGVFEAVNSWEVEIAFVLWWILLVLIDADDMTAVDVTPHTIPQKIINSYYSWALFDINE